MQALLIDSSVLSADRTKRLYKEPLSSRINIRSSEAVGVEGLNPRPDVVKLPA